MRLFVTMLACSALASAGVAHASEGLLPDGIDRPCDTPSTWAQVDPEPLPWTGPGIDLAHRDAYGAPHVLVTEHFAIRYGDEGDVSLVQLERLGAAFEAAWTVHIDEMGHLPPRGTDEAYFNVYIGDSDPSVPEGRTAAGYYTADRQGWPMIVIAARTLARPDYSDITAAHEFYHAVQGATGRFEYQSDSHASWFWEASATWASSLVYPDNEGYAAFIGAYALLPHHRVDAFAYPRSGDIREYYQYGSFVFLQHLSEATGSTHAVRDAWLDQGDQTSPVEVLREKLAEDGFDLDTLWLEHIARNATWDYPQRAVYRQRVQFFAESFPGEDRQVAGWLDREGMDAWWSPPTGVRPQRYGSNVLVMERPLRGHYRFEVLGQPLGAHGYEARYGGSVVLEDRDGQVEYRELSFDGQHGAVEFVADAELERAYLVLGAWTPEVVPIISATEFPYEVKVGFEPELELDPDASEARACGCSNAGGLGAGWLVVLLGLVGARRRR